MVIGDNDGSLRVGYAAVLYNSSPLKRDHPSAGSDYRRAQDEDWGDDRRDRARVNGSIIARLLQGIASRNGMEVILRS
jgi:hypothetical protein